MASKKSAADKVFDVAKPGTSTPDIGSKPMIVGHKSMAGDPMVRESAAKAKEAAMGSSAVDTEIKPQPTKIKIQPLGDEEPAEEFAVSKDQTETSTKSEAAEAVTQDTKATEEAVADDRETTGTTTTETESKSDESQNSDDIKQKNETPGSEESADDKAKVDPAVIESERDENVKKLIASKKYRLNIKETKERSSKNTVFAGVLILVVALAGLYLLVDTGKLNIGFEVPFHVLGKKQSASNAPAAQQPPDANAGNGSTKANEQSTPEPVTAKSPISYKVELQYPNTWKLTAQPEDLTKNQIATETYTLPSGTQLIAAYPQGGRGGGCTPKDGDVPGAAGNACPTQEILSSELIDVDAETSSYVGNMKVYLQHIKFTDVQGRSSYSLCIYRNYSEQEPIVGTPTMGLFTPDCYASEVGDMKIVGPANDNLEFFNDADVKAIEAVLKTFKLKKIS